MRPIVRKVKQVGLAIPQFKKDIYNNNLILGFSEEESHKNVNDTFKTMKQGNRRTGMLLANRK